MLKYLWKNKLLIILLLLIIWLCPTTISLPEQGRTDCIVTAVGVDKKEGEYEISLQYVVPQSSGGQENLKISTQKGKTVGESFEKLSLELGKNLGFSHCRFLAFNEEAANDDLTKIFDYLLRQKTNTNNIVLINTTASANELLTTAKGVDSDLYTFLSNSGFSNELKEYNDLTTIGDFYRSYFGTTKCFCVYVIDTEESGGGSGSAQNGQSGGGATSTQSGGGSSGGGSSSEEGQKEISNEQKLMIVKGDRKLISLSTEESQNIIWFNADIKRIKFEVENFKDEKAGTNIDTLVNVFNRIVTKKVYFDNENKPHYKLKIKNYVRASQLVSDNLTEEHYEISQNRFDEDFIKVMEETAIKILKKAEKNFKENNYDVIDCYDLFYKYKNKQLKEYLKNNSKEDFIKNVIFEYDISFVQGS